MIQIRSHNTHFEPALGHEEVVFDAVLPKLLRSVEAHGSILIIDLPFVLVIEDGVGVVYLLKFLCSFGVVWVLIRMMPQSQFPANK